MEDIVASTQAFVAIVVASMVGTVASVPALAVVVVVDMVGTWVVMASVEEAGMA